MLLKKSCAESDYQIANPRYIAPPKFHLPFNHRKLDWDDFHWLRKKGDQVKQTYRSKVRRAHVDDARDYWSTMCMEYFPHPNFRSVFFAYLPAREEDILAIPGTDFGQF
ncbi:unnamed protein product [Timema podura]|uniref:DUF4771 domain-containing protein n=1 Tax=Timema podura TaxID=61482 RepID=A0ABN7PCI5_TIMPD|nr:unnamed protein product [Timema podura]